MLIAQAYAGPMQEPEGAAAALERGLAAVASVDDALVMAAALARHGASEADRAACLARGEALAATTADWLELDRVRSFARRGAPDPLDHAGGAAIDDLDRRRVAYARALRDNTPDHIAEIAVPLLPPHAILPRRGRAAWWPHDPARLLDLLRGRLERGRLDALIERSSEGATEHTPTIEAIWRTGLVPYPMHLTPIPPLSLERWTAHESAEHAARAFACAVLCIGTAGADRPRSSHESSLAVLLDSCVALGLDAVEALIGLLVALVESYDDSPIRLFAQLGLVLAAAWRDASDPELPGQVARLIDDTSRVEARLGRTEGSPHGWLYELTRFDQRHELWQSLAALILGPLIAADPHLARLAALLRADA
jgi:hypothetical protein